MEVPLSPDLDRFVDYMVAKGEYASRKDVVRGGLMRMRGSDEDVEAETQRLRAMIQVGIDAADRGELLDGEEAMRELRERFAAQVVGEAA